MAFQNQVAIGPEFFAKAKQDYADFYWAVVREFMQNSIDAKAKRIDVTVTAEAGDTVLTVANDGVPMTREILVDKLLALGGSGKGFADGAVGGFGKAKEILYFCHRGYKIRTGYFTVRGAGAGYDIEESMDVKYPGTVSTVVLAGDRVEQLAAAAGRFADYAQWVGELYVNGDRLPTNLRKGSPRRSFSWGTVYTNKGRAEGRVVVRVHGIPMFVTRAAIDRTVVIELDGDSAKTLTANRDGFRYEADSDFDEFIADLTTNKAKALKAAEPTRTRFGGTRFAVGRPGPATAAGRLDVRRVVFGRTDDAPAPAPAGTDGPVATAAFAPAKPPPAPGPASRLAEEFILKNETTLTIPDLYRPDADRFSSYARRLVKVWGGVLFELHRLLNHAATFAVGFVFSDEAEAQYETGAEFGAVYYLNPVVIGGGDGGPRTVAKRFAGVEKDRILAIAAHEVVHGFGHPAHDEVYANRLTDVFALVMANRKRFDWCFKP